jgi:hypothetical protein
MNSQDEKKAREEIRNVERAMVARLAELSDAELAVELREDGIDLDAHASPHSGSMISD